jgi:hypothetical protein
MRIPASAEHLWWQPLAVLSHHLVHALLLVSLRRMAVPQHHRVHLVLVLKVMV